MSKLHPPEDRGFQVEREKPLIGVLVSKGDREIIEYFTDEEAVEAALPSASVQKALSLLGAWKDIDSDDALEQLDRIRHESKPTPPTDSDFERVPGLNVMVIPRRLLDAR